MKHASIESHNETQMKEKLFVSSYSVMRLTEYGNSLFDRDIAEENGFKHYSSYADGQNIWGWRDNEGFELYGSSDLCEQESVQYTELPETYRKLFLTN